MKLADIETKKTASVLKPKFKKHSKLSLSVYYLGKEENEVE